ncbi:hypothetical protein CLOM_g13587 [Closterium sp. NIES-68]|nr:hypothetical protein CLOM_g13587 [Closterium sp. NIES-68]
MRQPGAVRYSAVILKWNREKRAAWSMLDEKERRRNTPLARLPLPPQCEAWPWHGRQSNLPRAPRPHWSRADWSTALPLSAAAAAEGAGESGRRPAPGVLGCKDGDDTVQRPDCAAGGHSMCTCTRAHASTPFGSQTSACYTPSTLSTLPIIHYSRTSRAATCGGVP